MKLSKIFIGIGVLVLVFVCIGAAWVFWHGLDKVSEAVPIHKEESPDLSQSEEPNIEEYFPLNEGDYWEYAFHKKQDSADGMIIEDQKLRMEVEGVFKTEDYSIMEMKGDLIRSMPDRRFGLVVKSNQVYYLCEETLDVLLTAVKNNESPEFNSFNTGVRLLFQFPLYNGQKFGGDTSREDQMYMWVVKEDGYFLRKIKGEPEYIPKYAVGYSSCGEEISYSFVTGIGITAHSYHHNGTIFDVEAKLTNYYLSG